MKSQSNRIKADRKPASTGNQVSRGVDKEITWEPEGDGELVRKEGNSFFLRETGEELEELILIGGTELLMSTGGRLFLRGEVEEYFDGKQWRPVGDDGTPTNRRRMGNADMEVTPAAAQKKPEIDGSLLHREGGEFFLRETGEKLDELAGSGPEELLKSKGGRFFLRSTHEEYFDGKQWLPESRAAKLKNPRRIVYEDRELSHEVALKWMFDNIIPSQMWEEFRKQSVTYASEHDAFDALNNLESKVYQASGVLFLVSNELGRELEENWDDRRGEASGIVTLGLKTAEQLKRAFSETHQAWPRAKAVE